MPQIQEVLATERLYQVIITTRSLHLCDRGITIRGKNQQHGDLVQGWICLEITASFDTSHTRHCDIHINQVRTLPLGRFNCFLAASSSDNGCRCLFEIVAHDIAEKSDIINQKNPQVAFNHIEHLRKNPFEDIEKNRDQIQRQEILYPLNVNHP